MVSIKQYRKKKGLTQAQLANELGVAISTVGMWELGERNPNVFMLKKLASFFGCTTDELLETVNEEKE